MEIGFIAMAITLVDVIVFLPLTMVGGIISNMLGQYSMVIVIATLMSLFVSFTLTPLLASRLGKIEHPTGKTLFGKTLQAFEKGQTKLPNSERKIVANELTSKRWILVVNLCVY